MKIALVMYETIHQSIDVHSYRHCHVHLVHYFPYHRHHRCSRPWYCNFENVQTLAMHILEVYYIVDGLVIVHLLKDHQLQMDQRLLLNVEQLIHHLMCSMCDKDRVAYGKNGMID